MYTLSLGAINTQNGFTPGYPIPPRPPTGPTTTVTTRDHRNTAITCVPPAKPTSAIIRALNKNAPPCSCPMGMKWNPSNRLCMTTMPTKPVTTAVPSCPKGTTWSSRANACLTMMTPMPVPQPWPPQQWPAQVQPPGPVGIGPTDPQLDPPSTTQQTPIPGDIPPNPAVPGAGTHITVTSDPNGETEIVQSTGIPHDEMIQVPSFFVQHRKPLLYGLAAVGVLAVAVKLLR